MRIQPLIAALLAALAVAPAFAKGPHGQGHGRGNDDGAAYADRHDGPAGCPPGLAKKQNGCLPPGQAKKVYRDAMVGHHVPPNAVYAIPRRVRVTLPRPPAGYRYAVVNDQVVLVSRTDIVVDIIRTIIG
jgi:Ni/Co efflux regulator RcnB